jgi:hypothetical protein
MWAMRRECFSTKPAGSETVSEAARPSFDLGSFHFFQQSIRKPHDRAAKAEV